MDLRSVMIVVWSQVVGTHEGGPATWSSVLTGPAIEPTGFDGLVQSVALYRDRLWAARPGAVHAYRWQAR
jgi:hypothetical protein